MKLRDRLVLTFLAITVILIAPAIYGLFALRELRQVAYDLSTRDAVGALALGRLQTAFERGGEPASASTWRSRARRPRRARGGARSRWSRRSARVDAELDRLISRRLRAVAASPAARGLAALQGAIAEEQQLVESGASTRPTRTGAQAGGPGVRGDGRRRSTRSARRSTRRARTQVQRGAATSPPARPPPSSSPSPSPWPSRWRSAAGSATQPAAPHPPAAARHGRGGRAATSSPSCSIAPERPDEIGDLARSFRPHDGAARRPRPTQGGVRLRRLARAEDAAERHPRLRLAPARRRSTARSPEQQARSSAPWTTRRTGWGASSSSSSTSAASRRAAGGWSCSRSTLARLPRASWRPASRCWRIRTRSTSGWRRRPTSPPEIVQADPDRLNEVVGNLLSNAFKFTPRGGQHPAARARRAPEDEERTW